MTNIFNRTIRGIGFTSCCFCTFALLVAPRGSKVDANLSGPQSESTISGLYYGTSIETFGTRAWLLWLDSPPLRGALYAPPGSVAIHDPIISSPKNFSFTAEGFRVRYGFHGTFGTDGISGSVALNHRGAATRNSTVMFTKYPLPERSTPQWSHSGLYSNGAINDESGDLQGVEMVVLENSPVIGAYVRFNQGYFPHALLRTARTTNGFTFAIRTEDGETTFVATFGKEVLELRRAAPPGRRVVLDRRMSLEQLSSATLLANVALR